MVRYCSNLVHVRSFCIKGGFMGYCQRCGGYCADNYTFCKRCYIALGSPYGTSISKGHECRKCGKTIFGRYNYCPDCAKRLGFLKEGY